MTPENQTALFNCLFDLTNMCIWATRLTSIVIALKCVTIGVLNCNCKTHIQNKMCVFVLHTLFQHWYHSLTAMLLNCTARCPQPHSDDSSECVRLTRVELGVDEQRGDWRLLHLGHPQTTDTAGRGAREGYNKHVQEIISNTNNTQFLLWTTTEDNFKRSAQ